MRKSLYLLCLMLALSVGLWAQGPAGHGTRPSGHSPEGTRAEGTASGPEGAAPGHGEGGHENSTLIYWKWANFALLAGVLGYLLAKNAGPYFRQRGQEIQQGIAQAAAERQSADARIAEIDRRLGNLEGELAELRRAAQAEMATEASRLERETAQQLATIQSRAEQEIASSVKSASLTLRREAATLALALAEQRLRGQMGPHLQDELVRSFVAGLPQQANRAAAQSAFQEVR